MRKEESLKEIGPVVENARRGGLLFIGYKAWAAPVSVSAAPSMRELLGAAASRAVWDDPRQPGARLAVMVDEYESSSAALAGLAGELEANQLATVPRGPDGIGAISFIHPAGTPPAIYFVRANLVVRVVSFGNRPIDVLPDAQAMDGDLRSEPNASREDGIRVALRSRDGGGDVLDVESRLAGDDAYLKVMAPGTDLSKRDGGIIVRGEGAVRVYLIEKGRETYTATTRRD